MMNRKMTPERGEITTLYLASCGQCHGEPARLEMAHDRKSAARDLRALGWKHTVRFGWLCSDCVREGGAR